MRNIIIFVSVLIFAGVTGCAIEHQSFPAKAARPHPESPHPTGSDSSGTIAGGSGPGSLALPETESDTEPASEAKPQRIPSLDAHHVKTDTNKSNIIHTVEPGETLSQIAVHYYGSCKDELLHLLKSINEIHETDSLQAGRQLILPLPAVDGGIPPVLTTTSATCANGSPKSGQSTDSPGKDATAVDKRSGMARGNGEEAPDPFNDQMAKGLVALKKRDYRTAHRAFSAAAEGHRKDSRCSKYLKEIEAIANHHFENGLSFYRKRNYVGAIAEIEKACIPPLEVQTTEYLFKSHFEIAMKKFLRYRRTGNKRDFDQAQNSLNRARAYQASCTGCNDYEEIFKKTHYNNGIKYFTGDNGEGMDKAVEEWEKVRFIDPGYKDVTENIDQAQFLLKKLRNLKKVS